MFVLQYEDCIRVYSSVKEGLVAMKNQKVDISCRNGYKCYLPNVIYSVFLIRGIIDWLTTALELYICRVGKAASTAVWMCVQITLNAFSQTTLEPFMWKQCGWLFSLGSELGIPFNVSWIFFFCSWLKDSVHKCLTSIAFSVGLCARLSACASQCLKVCAWKCDSVFWLCKSGVHSAIWHIHGR